MPQRKAWTPQEDKTLKHLRQQLQINKWSIIAKKMAQQYDMPGRTGKQCRERYHNHLDSAISRSQWTRQQEQNLYKLHDQIGNKWAIIAQRLPGRTDNCVKNHFYSRMRKAIRKLNKAIHLHFKKEYKEIKMPVLYKIVEATDEKFKTSPVVDEQVSKKCCGMKNLLLMYSNDQNKALEEDHQKLKQLYNQIHQFSLKYKHKQKRARRNSGNAEDFLQIPRFQHKGRTTSDRGADEQDYSMSINPSEYGDQESSYEMVESAMTQNKKTRFSELKLQEKKSSVRPAQVKSDPNLIKPPVISLSIPTIQPKISLNMEQDQDKLAQLLRNRGVLQQSMALKPGMGLRRDDSFNIMLQQSGRHHNMLGQSVDGIKIPGVNLSNLGASVQLDQQHRLFISN